MSKVYDVDWYRQNIADPETGEPIWFTGTQLGSYDFELDALYYGVEHENERRKAQAELNAVFTLIRRLAGEEVPDSTKPQLLDQTAWLQAFDVLEDPHNWPEWLDPMNAVNFRLDVMRAMAQLPQSYRRALVHRMDGYELWEIADLMGWLKPHARVVGFSGESYIEIYDSPNDESAERVVRKASSTVRAHCSLGIRREPEPPDPTPKGSLRAGNYTTDCIGRIEHEIDETRAWRYREQRRRSRRKAA